MARNLLFPKQLVLMLKTSLKKFIAVATLFSSVTAFPQKFYSGNSKGFTEIGVQGGISGYRGDLGGTLGAGSKDLRDFDHRMPNLMVSVNATYAVNRWLNIRPNLTALTIYGDDKSLSSAAQNDKSRFYRNLSFRSNVFEATLQTEVNPFFLIRKYADQEEHKFFPYSTFGVGIFRFNPMGNLDGKWYQLQPLSTEGQGMEEYPDRHIYRRLGINIPLGVGFKYYVTPNFYAGAEALYRKTFTDYLDDVSSTYIQPELFDKYFEPGKADLAKQLAFRSLGSPKTDVGANRGSPKSKDAYFSFGARIGIVLGSFE